MDSPDTVTEAPRGSTPSTKGVSESGWIRAWICSAINRRSEPAVTQISQETCRQRLGVTDLEGVMGWGWLKVSRWQTG